MNFTVFSRASAREEASPVASKCRKPMPNWKPWVHSVQPREVYLPATVKTGVPLAESHAASMARIFWPASSKTRAVFLVRRCGVSVALIFIK